MNLDIQTEHVTMRPAWHHMIDTWVARCRTQHPAVLGVDLTLRHGDRQGVDEEVEAVATASGRSLRARTHAPIMTEALRGALADLERELLVHEAVTRRV